MRRLGADLEEKQEPRVASLAGAEKGVQHEVIRTRLDTGRDREAVVPVPRVCEWSCPLRLVSDFANLAWIGAVGARHR